MKNISKYVRKYNKSKNNIKFEIVRSTATNKSIRYQLYRKAVNTRVQGVGLDTSRFRYNQVPVESPNGVLVEFTLPNGDNFLAGYIEVFINGNQKIKDVEWEENYPDKITLLGSLVTYPPTSEETIRFNYIRSV